MTAATLALIGATVVFSSFVSAVFGMAGGMVLLGVLADLLAVCARRRDRLRVHAHYGVSCPTRRWSISCSA
jgi:hypothetical protein